MCPAKVCERKSNRPTEQIIEKEREYSKSIYCDIRAVPVAQGFFLNNRSLKVTQEDYNVFATSYLCTDIPFDSIICEDSPSYKDVETFSEPVVLDTYSIRENTRRVFGPSVRKAYLIPTTQWILNDLEHKKLPDSYQRIAYLYTKAQQWCEVNKALTMDHKYPKPDPNILRGKYSKTHQRVAKLVRRDIGILRQDPIMSPVPLVPFPEKFLKQIANVESSNDDEIYASYDSGKELDQEEKLKWVEWKDRVFKILGDIQPIPELQKMERHWQSKAEDSWKMKLKPKKKYLWKRNVYPPMTMEDYIRKKRKLLPPIKPEYLQTDYLSGIWKPELMINEFEITPLNYDSRLGDHAGPDAISWWVVHEATQKCWKWLHEIPSDL
ncbi:unnamed protein product [Allacma fusca]|uniref:Uncharacterized protein n=1 Tax=Allacma fusca TaxID=39272 RepID=A0A8J2P205_9HEXA|nr:unnamed protein product [Allacma fusca]